MSDDALRDKIADAIVESALDNPYNPDHRARRYADAAMEVVNKYIKAVEDRLLEARDKVARIEELVVAAEKLSPIGAAFDIAHPDLPAAVLIPVRELRPILDSRRS